MSGQYGKLVLVPNTLDLGTEAEVDLRDVLPQAVIVRAATLGHWVAENAKTTRALLKRVDRLVPLAQPLQAIQISELPRPPKGSAAAKGAASAVDLRPLLAPALAGHDIGLLSEAGLPAVADPGAALVQAAHALGITVVPMAGPSALLLALAASGLNGQSFAFVGYLPVEAAARAARIRELDSLSRRLGQTQIAIETPYRNDTLLAALIEHLQPATRLAVACGLTLPGERCETRSVAAWRHQPAQPLGGRLPAVFSWLAA
jgi:16S rRNA (cytidine1402-2'-O)-methyltransferase